MSTISVMFTAVYTSAKQVFEEVLAGGDGPLWLLRDHPYTTTTVSSILLVPLLYYLFTTDWRSKDLPPRMSIVMPALLGRFSLKTEGPLKFIRQGYDQFGDVFRIKLLNQGVTFCIGHDANSVVFDASDRELTQREVYKFTVPVFGPNIVYDAPSNVMVQQLKFVRHGLTGNSMRAHAVKILEETEDFFSQWGRQGEVNLFESLSELTILTASRCLLGDEIRHKMHHEVAKWYEMLNDGMTHVSLLFPRAPTAAHRRRDEARSQMDRIFRGVVNERRHVQGADGYDEASKPEDFLQMLIDAEYRDGTQPSDEQITGLLLAALFAGQHTSSITSTWMGFLTLQKGPALVARLLDEQREVLTEFGGELTYEALHKMELLHVVLKETLRLFPPLVLLMRKVQVAQKFKNYVIPKGDVIVACPPVSHRLDDVYTNPEEFDPDRFLPPRNEGHRKYDYIAFGGGRHACLGNNFAFLQIKTIWSVLLRHFEFEVVHPAPPKVNWDTLVAGPANDTTVRFKRRADPLFPSKRFLAKQQQ